MCSMSMVDIKSYLEIKLDEYINRGVPKALKCASDLGLQKDGTVVLNSEVCTRLTTSMLIFVCVTFNVITSTLA